jgi:deazaflavin-dependent oxidoreductase (nitroreductase family)
MPVRLTPRGTRGSTFFDMPPGLKGIFAGINVGFYRLIGRRIKIQGRPLLLLTTVGAKTAKRRQAALAWFEDDPPREGTWLVVASKGGSATHPGWYVNLARRPKDTTIEVSGETIAVEPESLHGPERERAWARIVALSPGYGAYEGTTDREIPVVRLTRRT